MIKSLSIINFALIKELELIPAPGLNVITGETGAGKSIMMGALGLLMGRRADSKALWDVSKKCQIEGHFDISAYELQSFFETYELDYETETIIRREVSPNGKSRAFINDTPVNLEVLKTFTLKLMDIHSQNESLNLGNHQYQLDVLDQFSLNVRQLKAYKRAYEIYQRRKKVYEELVLWHSTSRKNQDYERHNLQELEDAGLDDIDLESLEQNLTTMQHAEEIKLKLSQAIHLLDEGDFSVIKQLELLDNLMISISSLSGTFKEAQARITSSLIELKDVFEVLLEKREQIEFDPQRIAEFNEQRSLIYRLQQKHELHTMKGLIDLREQLSEKLDEIDHLDEKLTASKEQMDLAMNQLMIHGTALSKLRQQSALNFEQEITDIIHEIGIENGRVKIEIEVIEPNKNGINKCSIQFSANKGVAPQSLKNIASGGELSRLIFAIKYLIADKIALPTLIFDEIDTGISGEIAIKMVKMMKTMAKNHQVISISHLPQFAAGGEAHFFVYKDHSADKSVTKIKELVAEERIEAIAQMIAGAHPTESAFKSARELLSLPQ
ncbi:MAG: DNA repair protein RecN [Cytophagales bacterium]|jgi:DNA repair protein RecN (Recombination protein N)|tara:strand:- start:16804 stop:18462 length:1659 start_codon:yes stop_codon:yes gene_type:complete